MVPAASLSTGQSMGAGLVNQLVRLLGGGPRVDALLSKPAELLLEGVQLRIAESRDRRTRWLIAGRISSST